MDLGAAVQTIIIDKLKQSVIANDMVATKSLLNSVRYEQKELLQQIIIEIHALEYIVDLNDGVPPERQPFPTIENLNTWIKAKGLDLNPYAVQNAIISRGTIAYQIGGTDIVSDSINSEAFKQVVEMARPDLQNKIKKEWQLLFKNNR